MIKTSRNWLTVFLLSTTPLCLCFSHFFYPLPPPRKTKEATASSASMLVTALRIRLYFASFRSIDFFIYKIWGRRGDRIYMVVGFTTTCVISVYQHKGCEFESRSGFKHFKLSRSFNVV